MSTTAAVIGTHTSLSVTGLATLASATYAVSDAVTSDTEAADYEVIVTLGAPTTPASNLQALVWGKAGKGSTYTSGPESGTTTTDEPNLGPSVAVPLRSSGSKVARFLVAQSFFDGVLPATWKLVFKNESGAALTAGSVTIAPVTVTTTA